MKAEIFQGFFATLADALDEGITSPAAPVDRTGCELAGCSSRFRSSAGPWSWAAGARLSRNSLGKQRRKIEHLLGGARAARCHPH